MLVLGRGKGEKIWVSGPCIISLEEVQRGTQYVRLGFTSPKSTSVVRAEIMTAKEVEQSLECFKS